ncbi:MAG: response regulator, partial [Deltaproteobacteria bacterium]|nr:response regulator [Deltaproteobacteria bacterium]
MKKFERIKIYSALEVANICGVVNQTSINWIKKSYLKAFITPGGQYRIYGEDLASFMRERGMKIPPELSEFKNIDSKNILLVEDDDHFAWQFLDEIKAEYPNYIVDRANDSFEAGSKLAMKNSDLILLNADMPGLDSLKVCKIIKDGVEGEKKSIIVFTGNIDNSRKKSLLNMGADVYL